MLRIRLKPSGWDMRTIKYQYGIGKEVMTLKQEGVEQDDQ